jgi:putative exosortase-associated protein (TIGR04073 family)
MTMTLRARRAAALAIVVFALLVLAPEDGAAQTAMRKAGRGLAAMTCSFLEVPGNMVVEGRNRGGGWVALGFAKGLGMIVPRVLVGVYEFVTCPVPAPADFRPILDPEFPWDYFETRPSTARGSYRRPRSR